MKAFALAALFSIFCPLIHAQTSESSQQSKDAINKAQQNIPHGDKRFPSDKAIADRQKENEPARKSLFDHPELTKAPNSFPSIDTPQIKQSLPDIEALARAYKPLPRNQTQDELFVFASFTMPKESLKRLLIDSSRAGAVVVFRGFKNNSMVQTTNAIAEFQNNQVNAVVNPNAFVKYKISAVPAVVLVKPEAVDAVDEEGCALPNAYAAAVGDATLDYSLAHIAKTSPSFSTTAQRYVNLLKDKL
jgi:conjugal transfer pilus assembly protein TrbC